MTCVGDQDVMLYRSDELAIPEGTIPPTQLPDEFHGRVRVYEIEDSMFPGYVYLASSYLLTECIDDGKYNAVEWEIGNLSYEVTERSHGPARMHEWSMELPPLFVRVAEESFSRDEVYCVRCLSWPSQAADWPTRHRNYGWPDSATVDRVVSNGCDVVQVAHRQCRHDGRKRHTQHRLSFSRAEIVLLNSWTPVQQIVYHMLRVFSKKGRLTQSVDNSGATALSNYHFKTLMMLACELKPRSWWTDDLNVVRLCVELLHTLAVWLIDVRCQHYFIHDCNLFDHPYDWYRSQQTTTHRLMSVTEASLSEWFIKNYIRICAKECPIYVSCLFHGESNWTNLRKAVSAVIDHRLKESLLMAPTVLATAEAMITTAVSRFSLTVRLCLYWMRNLSKIEKRLWTYFIAIAFLHVAYKTKRNPLTDEFLDVLSTTCLQSNDVRRCLNARRSSALSLSQAAELMKVVANNSRSTVQLIEIELSKAYLYRALRCKDSDSDSIYCLANVYLAVLYYTTGQYQRAIDHCTLVTRSQDHSQCSCHVVEGEVLPKIDDEIDTVLGLAVFYQYLETAALNKQQTQHVSVFTTELFAHYLHIRCLSITTKCRQLTQASLADEVQRYQDKLCELHQVLIITDLMLLRFVNRTIYPTDGRKRLVVSSPAAMPGMSHSFDTSELVELLQQSAVEHLTAFRQLEAPEFRSSDMALTYCGFVTTDMEALYAYKRGDYHRCLQLSTDNVHTLIGASESISHIMAYPEYIQLMDDDLVSLIALAFIVDPLGIVMPHHVTVLQLPLSLYLMTQCQIKLHHPLTSLDQTLKYVEVARLRIDDRLQLNELLLVLIERKILLYISGEFCRTEPEHSNLSNRDFTGETKSRLSPISTTWCS